MSITEKIKDNILLVKNFSYLSILQIFTLLAPFITYPYLLRVLGYETYGKIIFAQAISTNLSILINFGFNVSGTNNVVNSRENRKELSKIISSIFTIKFMIWLLCLFIYITIIEFVPALRKDSYLYIISFFITFNDLLFPIWFFQGIEKMKYITFINVLVRLLFVLLTFSFVKNVNDYLFVPISNATGALLGGSIAVYILIAKEGIVFRLQSFKTLKYFFLDSLPLFVSTLSVQIYINLNKIVIGSFIGMKDVAIYDIAEKISTFLKIPTSMIAQATFPKIVRERNISFINKIMIGTSIVIFFGYLIVFVFTGQLIHLLTGHNNDLAINIVRVLSFSGVIVVFNYFLGQNRFIAFGYKKYYMRNTIFSSFLFIALIGLSIIFKSVNIMLIAAINLVIELFVLALNIFYASKLKILKSK